MFTCLIRQVEFAHLSVKLKSLGGSKNTTALAGKVEGISSAGFNWDNVESQVPSKKVANMLKLKE